MGFAIMSGTATIYRLYGKPDAPELFRNMAVALPMIFTDEMVRAKLADGIMPLPTIKHFIRTPDDAWFTHHCDPRKTAFQVLEEYPDSGSEYC